MVSLYLHAHRRAPAEAPRLSMPEGVYKTPEQVLRATSVALLAA